MKFVESHSNDTYYNLSFEEYIFKNLPLEEDEYVYLWINEPSIIVGTNQNVYNEINEEYVNEKNLKVARRITGGGAVYHDFGNLNFSFVTKTKGSDQIDFKKYYIPIVNALKAIGIDAELSGRNDITIDGKKCIGSSQSIYKNRVLSNGCILFDVKMSELAEALKVRKEKLEDKGVKSVKARVTNIKPYLNNEEMTAEDFKEILKQEIFKQFNEEPKEYIMNQEDLDGVKYIYNTRFSLKEWNYGRNPKTEKHIYKKLPAGGIELSYNIKHGKIDSLIIQGDFFGKGDVKDIEALLRQTKYQKQDIIDRLKDVDMTQYFGNVTKEEFAELFF